MSCTASQRAMSQEVSWSCKDSSRRLLTRPYTAVRQLRYSRDMADPPQILVIDDDAELCELPGRAARSRRVTPWRARATRSPASRAQEERRGRSRSWCLDVMLPGLNGFEVLTRLRQSSRVPVLMLTARGEDVDRIVGLEMGADDYLPKPFNPRELVAARVRGRSTGAPLTLAAGGWAGRGGRSFRRRGAGRADGSTISRCSAARRVRVRGEEVRPTTAEFDLLEVLARQAGTVVSREDPRAARPRTPARGVRPRHRHARLEPPPQARAWAGRRRAHQDGPQRGLHPRAGARVKRFLPEGGREEPLCASSSRCGSPRRCSSACSR